MVIKCFAEQMTASNPLHTTVDAEQLQSISDFVSKYMLPRQPHWPVSGDNAAKHSSGGHTNAILKNPLAYQPFDPKETGKRISFLFGPLSGGNHAKAIIESSGFTCCDAEKSEIAQFIKDRYPQRRKGITDDELIESYIDYRSPIKIDRIDYSKKGSISAVKLHGKFFEHSGTVEERHEGRDSALAAVKKLVEQCTGPIQILNHRSQSEGAGFDAISVSEVVIVDRFNKRFEGRGTDQDIEISAIRAFINAVNRSFVAEHFSATDHKATDGLSAIARKPLFVA